jgi:hypothetical protein
VVMPASRMVFLRPVSPRTMVTAERFYPGTAVTIANIHSLAANPVSQPLPRRLHSLDFIGERLVTNMK